MAAFLCKNYDDIYNFTNVQFWKLFFDFNFYGVKDK